MDDPPAPWPDAPRYAPAAPLPPRPFVPGRDPHPRRDPAGSRCGAPEPPPGRPAARWRDDASWLHGVDLYHRGFLWEAHEAWEAVYFASADPADRDLVQGLIQLAAALLQRHRGIANGVRRLARAAAHRLRSAAVQSASPHLRGLDLAAIVADVERHLAPALGDGDPLATRGPAPRLVLEPGGRS